MTDYEKQWGDLTPAEKSFIKTYPQYALTIKSSKKKAFEETKRKFGRNGHNDISDAFRHCFWSAILARDIGEIQAKRFTDAHEDRSRQPIAEKMMDLHNNKIGIEVGVLARSTEAVDRGKGLPVELKKTDFWISNYISTNILSKGKLRHLK